MEVIDFDDIKTVVISAVIVLNITLNVLVIAVIVRHPQLREDRTTLFMLSLTLSDLANGCTAMPISAALCSSATPNVRTMRGFLPKIQLFCSICFNFVSMHSLCWVTLCKMIVVTKPFRCEQILSRHRCYAVICCTWCSGLLLAASLLHGPVSWNIATCMYNLEGDTSETFTAVSIFGGLIIGLVVPITVIVYATVRICCVIARTHRQITAQVASIGGEINSAVSVPSSSLKSIRSARNVLLICLAYVVLTIPVAVGILAASTGNASHFSASYAFIAVWVMLCNSSVNSIIYLLLFRAVRTKAAVMISTCCHLMTCS